MKNEIWSNKSELKRIDPALYNLIHEEITREQETINLIASENYAHESILQATGSVLTNKYAEGYPSKRYYAGCAVIDQVELLAQQRAKILFGAEHVNVQPHAGCQANLAVFCAALKPGDTILGMGLAAGGHLTHGHTVNISGTFFKSVQYTVNKETEQLDYDEIYALAKEHRPKLIIAGASAYSRFIDFDRFAAIAHSVGAFFMADIAHIAGLIAAGLHPTAINLADFVTSTTHKTLRGPRGGLILSKMQHAQAVDKAIMPGTQGGPFMHVIAAKAVAFQLALEPEFKTYQQQVLRNAAIMANAFKDLGYRIVAGGTDNHLFIIDLTNKNIEGKKAQEVLEKAGITVSRSAIPFDTKPPWITSGIRIGTPAITTRGFKEEDALRVVQFIDEVLRAGDNEQTMQEVKKKVEHMCQQFPLYAW